MNTKKLTTLSIFTALQVIMLITCMYLPSGRLTVLCIISAINGLLYRSGTRTVHILISFLAVSLLGYLFMFNPVEYLSYVFFFGLYGIIHHLFMHKPIWQKQLVRWGYFILACVLLYLFAVKIIGITYQLQISVYLIPIIGAIGFVIYQFAYDLLINIILNNSYLRKLFFSH